MLIGIKGLVLKVIQRTDSDRLIVLFTAERGKITVCAKGSRSAKSKLLPCIEPFSYSEFILYEKDGFFWIKEGVLIENFYSIRENIKKLALASYICDILDITVYENMEEPELLRLALNSLYAVSTDLKPLVTVKAVFEMRTSALLGFAPNVENCSVCGKASAKEFFFSLHDGEIVCGDCRSRALKEYLDSKERVNAEEELQYASQIIPTSIAVLSAVSYILSCPSDKIFAFTMDENELNGLSKFTENHLVYQLEKKPQTLSFYHEVEAL